MIKLPPLLFTLLFISILQPCTQTVNAQNLVGKFAQVDRDIYRSARPSAKNLADLKERYHFGLILNIENNKEAIQQEQETARQLGVEFVSSPMSWLVRPSDQQIDQILNRLRDRSHGPILLHCKMGEDRTGLVVGLYRVLVQKWSASDAYEEMLAMGFHPYYKALDKYFRDRTGYR
jgi:protein tyrosine/serine phosphatase